METLVWNLDGELHDPVSLFRHADSNVKHKARLTGSECSIQDRGWNCGESFELRAGVLICVPGGLISPRPNIKNENAVECSLCLEV